VQEAAVSGVAVIGLACRLPGAHDAHAYWENLVAGRDGVSDLPASGAIALGVPEARLAKGRVLRWGVVDEAEAFDAGFFGFSDLEAEITDPQQRLFLELCASALEVAGYGRRAGRPLTGLYAAAGSSGYRRMVEDDAAAAAAGPMLVDIGNAPEHLSGRCAHKLDLRGPISTVQTACSSGLVVVHNACLALLNGECDIALAGAVSLQLPQAVGYDYHPGGIASPDGRTRAFDADAAGTVGGNGAGVVVLRRLEDALAAGDHIHAIVRGSATNNDGAGRSGYAAPGAEGQARVIGAALAAAGLGAAEIDYVECHGSGTPLGDAIELSALKHVFAGRDGAEPCLIGSVKSNLGHLREAAGMAGFLKAVLAVEHGVVPPSLHWRTPNPEMSDSTDLTVATEPTPWRPGRIRRAGVSSFGLGGTNAHVIVEAPPLGAARSPGRAAQLLTLSARSPAALDRYAAALASGLADATAPLCDIAATLAAREPHPYRRFTVATDARQAAEALKTPAAPAKVVRRPRTIFLIAGAGDSYRGLAAGLYREEPQFRAFLDEGFAAADLALGYELRPLLRLDEPRARPDGALRALLRAAGSGPSESLLTLPQQHLADFIVAHALAGYWMALQVRPDALLGYSLGELTAATLAGVFSLQDAARLVAGRAALIETTAPGGMLVVCQTPEALAAQLPPDVHIAARTGAVLCVAAGPANAVSALQADLHDRGIAVRRLPSSYAIHTPAMGEAAAGLRDLLRSIPRGRAQMPILSNVTGEVASDTMLASVDYWISHLTGRVRFYEALQSLADDRDTLFLEIGPGQVLSSAARQTGATGRITLVSSLPSLHDAREDRDLFLEAVGRCWGAGCDPDWTALWAADHPHRLPLATYPFERRAYSVPQHISSPAEAPRRPTVARAAAILAAPDKVAAALDPLEAMIASLFAEALGLPAFAPDEGFFDMGGHSLLAVHLLERLQGALDCDVDLERLYAEASPRRLAAWARASTPGDTLPGSASSRPAVLAI
jgi:phthiocerol/phenolphthiocerol synthesis type-I polyketide synthase E